MIGDNNEIRHISVLLVDDEPAIITMLTDFIKPMVSDIYTASNGIEALEIAETHDVDIAIIDIAMPKMNGLKMLHKLKIIRPNVVAIIHSAYGDKDKVQTALREGAYDFLDKPCDIEFMTSCLKRAIEKSKTDKLLRELLELLLYRYTEINPNNFNFLSDSEKANLLLAVKGVIRVKLLKEKEKQDSAA